MSAMTISPPISRVGSIGRGSTYLASGGEALLNSGMPGTVGCSLSSGGRYGVIGGVAPDCHALRIPSAPATPTASPVDSSHRRDRSCDCSLGSTIRTVPDGMESIGRFRDLDLYAVPVLNVRALLSAAPADERALIAAEKAAQAEVYAAERELAGLETELGESDPEPRSRWLTALALTVLVAAIAAVGGGYRYSQADQGFSDAQYMRAATERVEVLLTPDVGDNDKRGRQILAGATGDFRDEFAQSTDAYTQFVQRIGTVATGTVDGVGISSRTSERATLLVTAAISVRTGLAPGQPAGVQRFRVQVDMVPDDGALKISALEFYP